MKTLNDFSLRQTKEFGYRKREITAIVGQYDRHVLLALLRNLGITKLTIAGCDTFELQLNARLMSDNFRALAMELLIEYTFEMKLDRADFAVFCLSLNLFKARKHD